MDTAQGPLVQTQRATDPIEPGIRIGPLELICDRSDALLDDLDPA